MGVFCENLFESVVIPRKCNESYIRLDKKKTQEDET